MKKESLSKVQALISLLVLIAFVLSACSAPTTPPPPTATPEPPTATPEPTTPPIDYSSLPFVGTTWFWLETAMNDDSKTTAANPENYSITFNADGTYAGKADCNQIAGSYTVDGISLTMTAGISTLMACPEGSQADAFLKDLSGVGSYLMQDGFLYLEIKFDSGAMKFSDQPSAPAPAPATSDSPLVGRVWQWLRLDMSDGTTIQVTNPPAYTLEFLADGTLSGQADCNTLGGTYTEEGASLKLSATQLTTLTCPTGSQADVYVQRLNEVATYVIQNNQLYLNLTMDSGNMVFNQVPVAVLPAPEAGQPAAQATAYVNVRSGPSTGYPVYGVMPAGRQAQVIGKSEDGAWWALSVPVVPLGQGWVSGQYVTTTNVENVPVVPAPPLPPTAEFQAPGPNDPQAIALDTVYVRSGPGESYPAYGVAPAGSIGALIGVSQDGSYYVVRINPSLVSTGFGWVTSAYTMTKNAPDPLTVIEAPPLPPTAAVPTPPAGAPTGIAMTALNVRSGPGTNYPVLAVAPPGAVAEITGKSSDNAWWQIRVPTTISADGLAWVSAGYVYAINTANVPVVNPTAPPGSAVTPAPPVAQSPQPPVNTPNAPYGSVLVGVTTDTVNLRAGPGNEYPSYGLISAGTTGVIVDQNSAGTWYAFSVPKSVAQDGKGWISASYVKVSQVNYATATAMATPVSWPASTSTPGANATSAPPITNACKIIDLKPVDGTVYKPNFEFDMKVTLKNTSTSTWDPNAVDVKFVKALNNIPIHTSPSVFDLPAEVKPDAETTLAVDEVAPAQEGVYGETWALVQGSTTLCQWSFTVTVKKP